MVSDVSAASAPSALPLRSRIVAWLIAADWPMILTIALAGAIMSVARGGGAAAAFNLHDPDNYMRLAEIRDWLGGQSWFDIRQYRVDPPFALYTHWSRIADLPAGGVIALLTPLVGVTRAEQIALMMVPPLLGAIAFGLIVVIADAVAGRRARLPAAMLTIYGLKFQWQFVPGRIDHHGLQIDLTLAAIAAALAGDRRGNGWLAALAAALSLGVGMETAPYLVVLAAGLALRWAWRGDALRDWSAGFFGGIALLLPLVFAATVPAAEWALRKGDSIGRGHVAAALIIGGALALAVLRAPANRGTRLALVTGIGALGGGAILAVFPEVIDRPYQIIGPMLDKLWMSNVGETQTVAADWRFSPLTGVARMAFASAALAAGGWLIARSAGAARDRFVMLTALGLVALVLTAWQYRAIALAATIATPLFAALVAALLARSVALAVAVGVAALALMAADSAVPRPLTPARPIVDSDCSWRGNYQALAKLPPGLVMGQIDLAGVFLVWTPHSVLASGIHRDVEGNRFSFETWMLPPDRARVRAAARGVQYLAFCPTNSETKLLAEAAPRGLAAALRSGRRFPWLQPVRHGGNQVFQFYRLVPPPA